MKNRKQHLIIQQMDKKLERFTPLLDMPVPQRGWIHAIRTTLNMSYRQFAKRLGKHVNSVTTLEAREVNKGITLKSLEEASEALNMKLVYGFVPKDGSIEKFIEQRAKALAIEIVQRTSHTMALEDQENTQERLIKAIAEKTRELKDEMPRYLWD